MARRPLPILPMIVAVVTLSSLQVQDRVLERGDVERVRIRWDNGEVHVRASTADMLEARARSWGPEGAVAFTHQRDGEIVTLDLTCRTPAPCGGRLELALPEGVDVEVDLGRGSTVLSGSLGDTSVLVGEGRIRADDLASRDSVLQVVQGDVAASWTQAPDRVVAAAVRGDVELRVPEADYHLEDLAGESELVNLVDAPGSPRRIRITTLGGNARIIGTPAVADDDTQDSGDLGVAWL